MNHVEETVELNDYDAVAVGMSLRFDVVNSFGDFLALREVVVSAVRERNGNDVCKSLKLVSRNLLFVYVNFSIREGLQLTGVIRMFVRQKNLRNLLRSVACFRERLHVACDVLARKCETFFIGNFLRGSCRKTCIYENHLVAGIDQIVLKASAIANVNVELIQAFFAAEGEGLCVKTIFSELNCFDFHNLFLCLLIYHHLKLTIFLQKLLCKVRCALKLRAVWRTLNVIGFLFNGDSGLCETLLDEINRML